MLVANNQIAHVILYSSAESTKVAYQRYFLRTAAKW